MRNFHRIAEGIDVEPLQAQIAAHEVRFIKMPEGLVEGQPGYWHREAEGILLRCTPIPEDVMSNPDAARRAEDELIAFSTRQWNEFTTLHATLYALMQAAMATSIGRVVIVRVGPSKQIYPHIDTGLSASFFARYHLVIHGPSGCLFICGDGDDREEVEMKSGELWRFNAQKIHSVVNDGDSDRVSVAIDLGMA